MTIHDRLATLLPRPVKVVAGAGRFEIDRTTGLTIVGFGQADHDRLVRAFTFLPYPLAESTGARPAITIALDPELPVEGHRLRITPAGIAITGGSADGCWYGVQTLRQLLPTADYRVPVEPTLVLDVPAAVIDDAPALAWRGGLLDVARHFFPTRTVLRFIDLLALHRYNRLQLHLTDDQGWRIESRRHPRLHEVGSVRPETNRAHFDEPAHFDGTPHGGYYTRADLEQIVRHAEDRGITVVPEIDLPGHTSALIAAYPEHGVPGTSAATVGTTWGIQPALVSPEPATMAFLGDVLAEITEIFPGPWVHLGGDESLLDGWPDGRARFPAFMAELSARLRDLGRTMITWDDAYAADPRAAAPGVVMAWRGTEVARRAAAAGHDVILAPVVPTYFDYYQADDDREPLAIGGPITLADVMAFVPLPGAWSAAEREHVLGIQFQLWTELIADERSIDYMAFPRACALAEVAWTGRPVTADDTFTRRLAADGERLDALGVEHRPLDGPRPWQEAGTGPRRHRPDGAIAARAAYLAGAAADGSVAYAPGRGKLD